MSQTPPEVTRNDQKPIKLSRRSVCGSENKIPGFVHQWVSVDPRHPNYIERYLDADEIGDQLTGYCRVEPWEIRLNKRRMNAAGKPKRGDSDAPDIRDDQGHPMSAGHRNGNLILIQTTEENYARYEFVKNERNRIYKEKLGSKDTDSQKHVETHTGGVKSMEIALRGESGNSREAVLKAMQNQE